MVGMSVLVLVVVVVAVTLAFSLQHRADPQRIAAVLRVLAVLSALVVAVALFPVVWTDSGAFAIWGLGLPVLLALLPLLAASTRWGVAVTWTAAVLLLGWSLLLSLGIGLFLLPAALFETAAAGTQRRPRETTVA